LRMHAGADLDQRADAAAHADPAARRVRDPAGELERRRLPRPVRPEERERLPLGNLERDVVERAHDLLGLALDTHEAADRADDVVAERAVAPAAAEVLGDSLEDDRVAHARSENPRSSRLKNAYAQTSRKVDQPSEASSTGKSGQRPCTTMRLSESA